MSKREERKNQTKAKQSKRKLESIDEEDRSTKKMKREETKNEDYESQSSRSQEILSEIPKSVKRQEIIKHSNSKHISFIKNIKAFSNMREFLDIVFENKDFSYKIIIESLILFVLESCGHNAEDKETMKLMKMICDNPSQFDSSHEIFKVDSKQIVGSHVLDIWNAYISDSDYFCKYKQIFSILGFKCIEISTDSSILILETLIETFNRLLTSPFRIVRFISIIAFDSLFRSITISADEKEAEIELMERKKSQEAKESKKICEGVLAQLNELIDLGFEFTFLAKSSDVYPLIREEVYNTLTFYFEKREFKRVKKYSDDLKEVVIKAIKDTDKMAKQKGIVFAEIFLRLMIDSTKISKQDEFYENVFKYCLSNIVTGDFGTCLSLLKILRLICKYYMPIYDGENFKMMKLFIFHQNTFVSKEIIEIICGYGNLKTLPLIRDLEKNEEVKIPSIKDHQESFKLICNFLDDSCFDEYTPAEIGESLSKVLICCNDTTVFNFKLYGVFMNEYQQAKKSKSKKNKKGKNSLQEIFVHMLKHVCEYLKAFTKMSKLKIKDIEKEIEFYREKEKTMHIDVLESLSAILSTYNVDDPIIEPTLSIFEALDFKNRDSPNDDLAQTVCSALLKLFNREIIGDRDTSNLSKIIYISMSKLSHIPSLQLLIKDPILELISSYSITLNKYLLENHEIKEDASLFLSKVFDLIMNFNILSVSKKEAIKFYNLVINTLTNVMYPSRKDLFSNAVLLMPKCCNSIYIWISSYILSFHDNIMIESDIGNELSLVFLNILQFYRTVLEKKGTEDDKEDEKIIKVSIQCISEFLMFTSNDVLSTKHPQIYQEVGKETIYFLSNIMNNFSSMIVHIAECFGKILMSNTLLFSSPLGQTYFSVLGNVNITKGNKEAIKAALNVLRFYKFKEQDGSKPKKGDKNYIPVVQFWSIFILLIINEYSIGRNIHENNSKLQESLTAAEISMIPSLKLENYLGCVKIINNVVEFMKSYSNKKQREKEAFIFIASFIKICSSTQGKNTFPCVMSILRFRRVFGHAQIKKMCTYIKRLTEEMKDSDNKQILQALVDEMDSMKNDVFGQLDSLEGDKEVPLDHNLELQHDIKMEPNMSQNSDQSSEKLKKKKRSEEMDFKYKKAEKPLVKLE